MYAQFYSKLISRKSAFIGLLFYTVVSITNPLIAQKELTFGQLSVADGLSQNSAISIDQDTVGYLWIATQNGLNRYDGQQFKVYPKKFADITQRIHLQLGKVYCDSKNRVWIIPENAIPELYDSKLDEFIAINGIKAASCIIEDSKGNIWMGTYSGQLYLWNEENQMVEWKWTDPSKKIHAISNFDEDQLLITFKNSIGLWNIKSHNLEIYEFPKVEAILSASEVDLNGNIWVGTLSHGPWIIQKGSQKFRPVKDLYGSREFNIEEVMICDIHADQKGDIWMGTYGKGVIHVQPDDSSVLNYQYSKQNPRSLHYNDVLCIIEDYSGVIWYGTDGAGMSFYDPHLEKFNFFHNQEVPDQININVVRSLYVDENQHIWIGTSGKGLTEYDPYSQKWETHKANPGKPNSIPNNRIMSLWGDGQGKLWIGHQEAGLTILDLKSRIYQNFNPNSEIPLPGKTIWKIFQDRQGRIWLATRNEGLIQFDPNQGVIRQFIHSQNDPHSIPANNIRTIEQGIADKIWVGTENQGIALLDIQSGQFTSKINEKSTPLSISSNHIKSLYRDSQSNKLWVGTAGSGLNGINFQKWEITKITTENGLSNDVIYGILPDTSGNLWISTNRGISKIANLQNPPTEIQIENFANYRGKSSEFNTGAYYKHSDGRLFFGCLEGFLWFYPDEINRNPIPPKTAITEFLVFDSPVNLDGEIALKSHQNTITIKIASLFFSSPAANRFQYKLKNYDENWVDAGNHARARYTKLKAGNYTFLARSSNYDDIWDNTPTSISFTILPPWYQTPLAYGIYVLLLATTLIALYRYLKWRWLMQIKLRLKEKEANRLREINEFKTNLFTNISHEFRTPLTLISGPVDRMIEKTQNPSFQSHLKLVKQNANRLLNLTDQMLEASKIKSGHQPLRVRQGNLSLLIQNIIVNYFGLASEKNITIKSEIPLITEVWFDHDKMEKVISNLLQNAIKYGKENSEIKVEGKIDRVVFILNIANESTISYSRDEIQQLFTRFFQKQPKSEGFGIGVSMVKDIIEACGGTIAFDYKDDHIFSIEAKIPVSKYSYDPEVVEDDGEENHSEDSTAIPIEKKALQNAPLILVIEDNTDIRNYIKEVLQNHYKILVSKNGNEGYYTAIQNIPDLIISDIMMPEKDGVTLCRELKSDMRTSHIPIILLTAKSGEEDILKGLEAGADDYFLKPISTKKLLIRVEQLIDLRVKLRSRYSAKGKISPKELALTSMEDKFLEKIKQIVDKKIADSNFNAETFSREMGMSRMQLHRKLTSLTGFSTAAFIKDQRLQMALQRLENGAESISEIAYSVGFNSPSYFTKCFKETYQMTPFEYQKRKGKHL